MRGVGEERMMCVCVCVCVWKERVGEGGKCK